MSTTDYSRHSVSALACVIRGDWGADKVYFGAVPYLNALYMMSEVTDSYGLDSGPSIVRYFLANASTWRGPVAKAVKAELKRRIAGKY